MDFPEKFKGVKRFEEVLAVLTKYEFTYLLRKEFGTYKKTPSTEPATIKAIFEELGGGFVKLGQLLSLRPDLIPQNYCDELAKLQDNVRPFPFSEAKKIIEQATTKKIPSLFSKFDKIPVASASVGQVYKAKLKTGEYVAVKVRRPGIKRLFAQDIAMMDFFAGLIKTMHGEDILDPEEIVAAFREYTATELDYIEEAKTIQKFYEQFKGLNIKIPNPHLELTTEDVLVMEYIDGIELKKILDQPGHVDYKKRIAKEIYNAFLKQTLLEGIFHADLHPGNILVLTGKEEKIALLDFGITGTLTGAMRAQLLKLFIALMNKDLDGIITSLLSMNFITADDPEIRKDLRTMLHPYYGIGLNGINLPKLFLQSIKVARKHHVKVSKDYVLLGKAILTVESVCAKLDPGFDVVEESKPFITRLMIHEYSPKKFLAQQILHLEHAANLTTEIPALVSRYFEDNARHNRQVEDLSLHILKTESKINLLVEKLVLMFTTIILLLAGLLLLQKGPLIGDISIFAIISFCMAAATFLTALFIRINPK